MKYRLLIGRYILDRFDLLAVMPRGCHAYDITAMGGIDEQLGVDL